MRTVCWGQVTDHSQHPASWNELEVDDVADTLEIKKQIVEDGSFADPPELRLLSDRGAWRKWEKLQTLPSGDIKVKVICHGAGQSDVHILAICHLAFSACCIEQGPLSAGFAGASITGKLFVHSDACISRWAYCCCTPCSCQPYAC